jgi:exopolyphosphatase/guanosine-5'-triphosphate,3'-diphosphate pyrophosphatase
MQIIGKSIIWDLGETSFAVIFRVVATNVFAAIDVGSQAVRCKIARHTRLAGLERIHRRRIPLRSGDHAFGGGRISREVADRMVAALRTCAGDAARHRATLRAVATSSLREAENALEILTRIRNEAGIELEVISGREEARLVCLGVLEGQPAQIHSLCIDLGGGSIEVALARGEHPVALHSVAAGALRFSRELLSTRGEDLRLRAARHASHLPAQLGRHTGGVAVGSSGTIRALVEFVTEGTRRYVHKKEMARAVDELAAMSLDERARWFDPHRAEVIAAGAALLEAILERLEVEVLHASKRGLRDGVLVDLSRSPMRHSRILQISQS